MSHAYKTLAVGGAQRWVTQTVQYDPEKPGFGNCTESAVASILNLPLDQVPSFRGGEDGAYAQQANMIKFLNERGFAVLQLPGSHVPDVLYLATGKSARGCGHAVVMYKDQLVHDPHPSAAGLLKVQCVFVLAPMDPAQAGPMNPHPDPEEF